MMTEIHLDVKIGDVVALLPGARVVGIGAWQATCPTCKRNSLFIERQPEGWCLILCERRCDLRSAGRMLRFRVAGLAARRTRAATR
jgi:hypothetical protein